MYSIFVPKTKPIFVAHHQLTFSKTNVSLNNTQNLLDENVWNLIEYVDTNYLRYFNGEYVVNKNFVMNVNMIVRFGCKSVSNNNLFFSLNFLTNPQLYFNAQYYYLQLVNPNTIYQFNKEFTIPVIKNNKVVAGLNTPDELIAVNFERASILIYTNN